MIRAGLEAAPLALTERVWCVPCARSTAATFTTLTRIGEHVAVITRTVCRRCGTKTTT